MYRGVRRTLRNKAAGLLCATGCLFQVGGCELGEITTTVTLSGEELVISLIRGAILRPIDEFVTNAVNEAFSEDR